MTRRLLVNDCMTATSGTRTFWHDLQEWFDLEFLGGDFSSLAENIDSTCQGATLIIRNGSYFGPLEISRNVPTITLIQDIFEKGPGRCMQNEVLASSSYVIFNSAFTESRYPVVPEEGKRRSRIISLPVDFRVFQPRNRMGLQQKLSLPDGCICWIGACREAGYIKGWDVFLSIVRQNPDLHFVGIFKDQQPEYAPPNLRMYTKVKHDELAEIIGACRVGLCTSRTETQHLAGIEMGACGLPLVTPKTGIYWDRKDLPGIVCETYEVASFVTALRDVRAKSWDAQEVRDHWRKDFEPENIKKEWEEVVKEVV